MDGLFLTWCYNEVCYKGRLHCMWYFRVKPEFLHNLSQAFQSDSWLPMFTQFYALTKEKKYGRSSLYEQVSSLRNKLANAYSKDSNQSFYPRSQIRVLFFCLKKHWNLDCPESVDQTAQMCMLRPNKKNTCV